MRRRRYTVEVEHRDLRHVLEDPAEVAGDALALFFVERESSELGDVIDLVAGDARARHTAVADFCWHGPSLDGAPRYDPPVAKHPFLSDEWFEVVEQLFEEHGAEAPAQVAVLVNVTVTETPFGDERQLHMGAREGRGHWGRGHADDADVTLTTDYETARDVLISGDPQAGMQAFMAGKVRLQGDFAKLMAAQGAGGPGATNAALAEAIQGITE